MGTELERVLVALGHCPLAADTLDSDAPAPLSLSHERNPLRNSTDCKCGSGSGIMTRLASTEHSQAVPAHYLDSHHLIQDGICIWIVLQFGNGPFETVAGHAAGSWPAFFFFFLSKKRAGTEHRHLGRGIPPVEHSARRNCLGQWPNSANSILVDGTAPDPINSPAIKSLFHCLLSNQDQAVKVNLDVDSTSTLISVFLRQASSRFSTCQRSSSQSDWLEPPEMAIHTPPRGETEHCTKD
ncbi:uncharacterized protein CLUP02_05726 [Colletotrichum lupini]|uniref:Uncharacterized protein n=1 Tax=Colletotrichum lupini TaxID=145971 RepID=A0A9Q8WEB7_9PEZI|nr:uncharacterized protein CLUP02_05726 [Colletotrichum lupini]UQC80244.1 hypothetical protein CLUP02_05726 [Colletotrichum lupini]